MTQSPRAPEDSGDLFGRLDPPPGGLARLRARLENERARPPWRLWVVGGATASLVVAVVAALLLRPLPDEPPAPIAASDAGRAVLTALAHQDPTGPSWVALGLVAPPDAPVVLPEDERGRAALLRVPVEDDRVVMYLIAGLEP